MFSILVRKAFFSVGKNQYKGFYLIKMLRKEECELRVLMRCIYHLSILPRFREMHEGRDRMDERAEGWQEVL